jgi:hypothetical protein
VGAAVKRAALALAAAGLFGCSQANPPVVKQQTFSAPVDATQRVAVVPFAYRPELEMDAAAGGLAPQEVADLVTTFVAEALAAQGIKVVPPSDVEVVFTSQGRAVPRRDPRAAAEMLGREFGATSVVLGEVIRWREREGEAYGADQPASVGFEFALRALTGRTLYHTRFDHTQRTLTADPLTARKYPGGGTRFLTAAELARWGANASAETLAEGQWRSR